MFVSRSKRLCDSHLWDLETVPVSNSIKCDSPLCKETNLREIAGKTASRFISGVQMNEVIAKRLALSMALMCVRNTCIEDIHAGVEPSSKAGDFSDAKLVTPYGKIPWNNLSRIRNDEMRGFMKQVVDRLYTVCCGWTTLNSLTVWINIRAGRLQNGMNPET